MLSFLKRVIGEVTVLLIVTQILYWILYILSSVSFNTRMIVIGMVLMILSLIIIRAKDWKSQRHLRSK